MMGLVESLPRPGDGNPLRCRLRCALAAVSLAALGQVPAHAAADPNMKTLIDQLENHGCRYVDQPFVACSTGTIFGSWLARLDPRGKYHCALAAARCLESLGPRAEPAVPALVRALRDGPNDYDTGDGWLATRSGIAAALGASGDARAIDPLAEALRTAVPGDRGDGALVQNEPAARGAIIEALGRFGSAAGRHWELVGRVLRERNADLGFLPRRREQFERMAAVDSVVEDQRRANPGTTTHAISDAEIAEARKRLDPASPDYQREFEPAMNDHLASTAALALGSLGRVDPGPLLVETQSNPAAAEAAARALAELGYGAPEALEALRALFTSPREGPAARRAAALALGRLGDAASVGLLIHGLAEPRLCEASVNGLGELGPRARAALPALRSLLDRPSLAVRTDHSVVDSLEASDRLIQNIAAVQAIEGVAGDRAFDLLAPYANDPDIGPAARGALKRLDPERARTLRRGPRTP